MYANHDYQGRDYVLSQYYFEKLIKNFPDSRLTSEARTYLSLFETIAASEKSAAAASEKSAAASKKSAAAAKQKSISATEIPMVVENQNFEEAVQKNLKILEEAGKKEPADQAFYNLGLIYAHVDNPAKDYKKSQNYFHALNIQFPNSPLAEEARIWIGLFETIEKMQQIDIDIEQQKKQLTR